MIRISKIILLALSAVLISACGKQELKISSGELTLEMDQHMHSRLSSGYDLFNHTKREFQESEMLITKDFIAKDFELKSMRELDTQTKLGRGRKFEVKGEFYLEDNAVTKIVAVTVYDSIPDFLFFDIKYVNSGNTELMVKKWENNRYSIKSQGDSPNFWSFQGSSSAARADWVLPLAPGFYQRNYMGMNDSDYGGGIPVTDIWRRDMGVAVGHLAMVPVEVSLPVDYDKNSEYVSLAISKEYDDFLRFPKGDTLHTPETFVTTHTGDFFGTLQQYSTIMQKKGIEFVESEPEAFEPIWCGWGYMRTFTKDEIINTLPKVKELGITWAVIDDGFQIAEGDWRVDTERFPGGARDMKDLVEAIHSYSMKAKLWWAPLAADPGSKSLEDDPLMMLINKEGAPQYITWWDSYYLSPAYSGTIEYTRETVKMFMEDWGFDGLKMDGQHMNAVPPDYNWERPLEDPDEALAKLPKLFETIYHTARSIKPDAVVENCPCGCCMSFYNMPYTNQFVSSDPLSSWQVRLKGKTYKAIAPHTAYYGDHVELSDGGNDFASSFGIGAVLGTKFTWPENNPDVKEDYLLTPEKEVIWKKWFSMYNDMMLSKGEYLGGLYDIGYDIPEAHVIRKDSAFYYAFYNDDWEGSITFKGLDKNKNYQVRDYFNQTDKGVLRGENPSMKLDFEGFMLLELTLRP